MASLPHVSRCYVALRARRLPWHVIPCYAPAVRQVVRRVADYFIYKDMYNPNAADRRRLLASGQPGKDGFFLLAKTLAARAEAAAARAPTGGFSQGRRRAPGLLDGRERSRSRGRGLNRQQRVWKTMLYCTIL